MRLSLQRIFLSELMFWLLLCAIGLYFVLPLRKSLRFGIDLVGGTYLTLQVQTEKAVESDLADRLLSIDAKLQKGGLMAPTTKHVEKNSIVLQFASLQQAQSAAQLLRTMYNDMTQSSQGSQVQLTLSDRAVNTIKDDAVNRNIEVLRTRMRDIPIAAQGERNIIVELPDTADPQEAKQRIGKAAQLELKIVENFSPSKEELLFEYDGDLPLDREILPGRTDQEGYYLVEKYADVTGRFLKEASPGYGGKSGMDHVVNFRFNDEGAERFYTVTNKNYGKSLAIVLDGVVISAPRINEPISGGSGVIYGSFTAESARELSLLLQSGSFVAPVTFEEERQIGPTLGRESIHQGLLSCLVGMGLLFVFSLFYYKLSGFFAFLALVYNLFLIIFALAWLQMPLTLPGIGGMLLTVGMAIDASILIYEHIKEELLKGMTVKQAVRTGFSDAMTVILDANITTFITGVVLYQFGTGPIQGFAVTMMLGIIATLITGLFFLRSIFKFVLDNFNVQKLSI